MLDEPIIDGPLPTVIVIVGLLAAAALLAGRSRRWWLRTVPVALACGVAVAALVALAVVVFQPFPDALPPRVLTWIGVFAAAVALGVARRGGWGRRVLAALAVVAVLGTCVTEVNAFYGYRPTVGAALGLAASDQVDLADVPTRAPLSVPVAKQALARSWHAPRGMPPKGRISTVPVLGKRSHFPARPAWLYLPPAYLSTPRARLPVLVLIAGQPGGPRDWLLAGRLATVMDAFAAAHDGLAPVVLVPDVTGSDLGNSLCIDSRIGAAETYLADDVPDWLAANLQVDMTHPAIGGFSFGGTCALQLALRRPDVYRTFLDVSGQSEPTLGDPAGTLAAAFGGDAAAWQRVSPLSELAAHRYPDTAGVLVVGRDDDVYRPQAEQVAVAAQAAGAAITLREVPGEHSWTIATAALGAALPWLAGRAGLLDAVPPPGADAVPVPRGSAPATTGPGTPPTRFPVAAGSTSSPTRTRPVPAG